jgi:hypothetical protein
VSYWIKALLVLTLAIATAFALIEKTEINLVPMHISLLCVFMFITSVAVHFFTLRSSKKEPKRFPSYFMGITGIKMLVYLAAIGIYILMFKELAIPMLIAFLALYLLYMVLEVMSIVSDLKKEA